MENFLEDTGVNLCCGFVEVIEIVKSVFKDIGAIVIRQAGIAINNFLYSVNRPVIFVFQKAVQKADDVKHIRARTAVFCIDSVDFTTHECP